MKSACTVCTHATDMLLLALKCSEINNADETPLIRTTFTKYSATRAHNNQNTIATIIRYNKINSLYILQYICCLDFNFF